MEVRYRYLSMGVWRVWIIFMARAHWVSKLSMVWGKRPVRFLEARSSGVKARPGEVEVSDGHWQDW